MFLPIYNFVSNLVPLNTDFKFIFECAIVVDYFRHLNDSALYPGLSHSRVLQDHSLSGNDSFNELLLYLGLEVFSWLNGSWCSYFWLLVDCGRLGLRVVRFYSGVRGVLCIIVCILSWQGRRLEIQSSRLDLGVDSNEPGLALRCIRYPSTSNTIQLWYVRV